MATLTVQSVNDQGTDLSPSAAAGGGDQFTNTGKEFIMIYNGDASAKTVTVTAQSTSVDVAGYGEVTKADTTLSVAAGSVGIIGPLPKAAYNDGSGFAQITYSAVTSVEVAVFRQS